MAKGALIKQTMIYGLPSIVGRFLNFLLVPLYTYNLSTSAYGVVTEFYAYIAFFMVLLSFGMETSFFRFTEKNKGSKDVFSTGQWFLFGLSALFLISVFLLRTYLQKSGQAGLSTDYLLWFALIMVADVFSILPFCKLREQNKAFKFALIKTLNISVNIALNLFFILFCPKYLALYPDSILQYIYHPSIGVGYIFIANLIASLVSFLALYKEWSSLVFRFNVKLWKEMLYYAFPIMIWGMAGIVNETFDRMILRFLISGEQEALSQLGIYGACYKISIVMSLFVQAFRYAAEPFFFKQAGKKDAPQVYADVMKYFVIVCSFIFLVCTLFLDELMYFVGKDFREGRGIVPVLLLANLFLGVFYNLSVWYKITDKTKIGAYISLIGAALTLLLNFSLIPVFGYHGAAWATLACYISISVISYFWGRKTYPIPYPMAKIGYYIILSFTLYALGAMLPYTQSGQHWIYAIFALGVFGYCVIKKEKDLKNMLLGMLNKN